MWILTNPLFNKETKQLYSWIPKGWTSAVINQTVRGSLSMISAFLSNSKFLCSLYHSTVDSFVFCDFVKLLKYSLTKLSIDIKIQVVVVLDNAYYHRSTQTIEWFKHHGINVEFLSPYWPNLAPVEALFKFIKSRVKKLWVGKSVNCSKPTGIKTIHEACSQISEQAQNDTWISFTREGRQFIYEAEMLVALLLK